MSYDIQPLWSEWHHLSMLEQRHGSGRTPEMVCKMKNINNTLQKQKQIIIVHCILISDYPQFLLPHSIKISD